MVWYRKRVICCGLSLTTDVIWRCKFCLSIQHNAKLESFFNTNLPACSWNHVSYLSKKYHTHLKSLILLSLMIPFLVSQSKCDLSVQHNCKENEFCPYFFTFSFEFPPWLYNHSVRLKLGKFIIANILLISQHISGKYTRNIHKEYFFRLKWIRLGTPCIP